MCEQGMKHVDWVNFDQINNAGMEGVDIQWGTMQFFREILYIEVVPLMSGVKGEEAHHLYKEGDGNHGGYVLDYYFFMVCYDLWLSSTV